MSENVEVKLEVKGAEQASSDINKETTALKALEAQSTKTAKATDAVDKSSKTASANMGQFGSTIGLAGQAIGKINPQLGQLTSMAGSATGAMQSLASTGFNAVGIAVAAVSLALTVGVQAWQAYADAERDAAKVEREVNNNLIANANSFDSIMSEQRTTRANQERHARIERGQATTEEYTAERERLNRQLAEMNGTALEGGAEMTRVLGERLNLETHMTTEAVQARADAVYAIEDAAAARLATAAADRARQAAEALARQAASERSARASAAAARRREAAEEAAKLLKIRLDELQAEENAVTASNNAMANLSEASDREAEANRIKDLETTSGHYRNAAALQLEMIDRELAEGARVKQINDNAKEDSAKKETQLLTGMAVAHEGLDLVVSTIAGKSAKSQKIITQVMAAASMTEAIIKGSLEVAKAAAAFALPFGAGVPEGIAHTIAAASFAVAATKAGIVAGGGGGGGGAPSGGGGGGSSTKDPGGGPSSSSGSSRGGDTINISIGSSGLVYAADRAQLGRDMDRMISESRSRLRG